MLENLDNFSDEQINDFYKKISQKVKNVRKKKKLSQLDLALKIDINSIAFYSNCENNKDGKHFNLAHIYKICQVLDVSLSEFFADF